MSTDKQLSNIEFERCENFRKDFALIAAEERLHKKDLDKLGLNAKLLQLQIQNLEIQRLSIAKKIEALQTERDKVRRKQKEFGKTVVERLGLNTTDFSYDSETMIVTE